MKKTALVFGLGVSGKAAAAFLLKKGVRVLAVDQKAKELAPELAPLLAAGLEVVGEDISLEGVSQFVLSPGISPHHPFVRKARDKRIEIIGEIELACRHLVNPCIAITGTNGKTTTALLVAHILSRAGKKGRALGNIGASLCEYLLSPDPEEILVVELSSFQLETLQASCFDVAAILNITPDHLDRHPSLLDYARAKLRIQNCLKSGGRLFVSQQVAQMYGSFLKEKEIFDERTSLAEISKLDYIRRGMPEQQNVEAAFCLCAFFGVSKAQFLRALEGFRKPAHRIEWVAEIDGVSYYDDSKGTNIDAVMHAVKLFLSPILLLAGGVDKGASYRPWIDAFQGKVKQIFAFGQAALKMESELAHAFPFQRVETLLDAVSGAKAKAVKGDVVLLSPGCSSFDQFRNYEHRGEEFKRMVKQWSGKRSSS